MSPLTKIVLALLTLTMATDSAVTVTNYDSRGKVISRETTSALIPNLQPEGFQHRDGLGERNLRMVFHHLQHGRLLVW